MKSPTGAALPHSYHLSDAAGVSQDVFFFPLLDTIIVRKTSQQRHRAPSPSPPTPINKPQMRPAQEEEPQTQADGYICPRRSHSQSSGGVGETSESREASPQCHRDVTCRDEGFGERGGQEVRRRQCCCCYIGRCHTAEPKHERKPFCHRVLVAVCQFLAPCLCMKQTLWPGFLEGKRHILHKNDGYCLNLKAPNGTAQLYRQFYTEILFLSPFSFKIHTNDKNTSTAITMEHVT